MPTNKKEKSFEDLLFEMDSIAETEPPSYLLANQSQAQVQATNNQNNVVKISEAQEISDWKGLIKIKSELLPVDAFPLEILPASFKSFVSDVSNRMQSSPDFVGVGLMVSFSSLVGRKFGIQPKQLDSSWVETPNLWGGSIGLPSSMKTPTQAQSLKFTGRLEKQGRNKYEDEVYEHMQNKEFAKIELKTKKVQAEKLIKSNKSEEAKKLLADIDNKAEPIRKRYKINDATVEKIGELLNENSVNGILVERDELSGLIANLDRPDKQSDKAFYLEGWNGKRGFSYDRIGRGTIDIKAVTISVFGGIQPDKIRRHIQGAIDCDESNDGFIQRFQLMVYPDIKKKWSYVDEIPNKEAEEQVDDVFQRIDAIENEEQVVLKFTQKAQEIFIQWLTEHEKKLRSGLHPAIESHLTKYRSLVPSLALIIYLAELVVSDEYNAESTDYEAVDEASILKACLWAEYLESHMYRIYSIGSNTSAQDAKLLSKRLNKLQNPFTIRDIKRKNWIGLKQDHKRINAALEILEANNYIISIERWNGKTGGRNTTDYHVNPKALEAKK